MSGTRDHVSIRINNMILGLSTSPCEPTIFRVDDDLRITNRNLYDPELLSIGPFNRGKSHLQKMEQQKFRYLKSLLERRKESCVDKYVMAMRSLEEKARRCYSEPVALSPDEFLEMLILDGCFIIELIRKCMFWRWREGDDTIFNYAQVLSQVRHDLMLVENQLPFFVLDQLFHMTKSEDPDDDFVYLFQLFIRNISPGPADERFSGVETKVFVKNADHLLGLLYRIWCSSFAKKISNRPIRTVAVNSTTELQEAGIKFQKCTETSFLDITFSRGVMKIPGFLVSDGTESVLRNLIVYKHSLMNNHPKYFTDYAFFLHCLANSSKDIQILRRHEILTNLLGDDEMVYLMFNRLGRNIPISYHFCYSDVFDEVNEHCNRRRNRWMANLRRNYFSSPWAVISFFAAVLLLVFTFIQTLFAVLSYVKNK